MRWQNCNVVQPTLSNFTIFKSPITYEAQLEDVDDELDGEIVDLAVDNVVGPVVEEVEELAVDEVVDLVVDEVEDEVADEVVDLVVDEVVNLVVDEVEDLVVGVVGPVVDAVVDLPDVDVVSPVVDSVVGEAIDGTEIIGMPRITIGISNEYDIPANVVTESVTLTGPFGWVSGTIPLILCKNWSKMIHGEPGLVVMPVPRSLPAFLKYNNIGKMNGCPGTRVNAGKATPDELGDAVCELEMELELELELDLDLETELEGPDLVVLVGTSAARTITVTGTV